MKKAKLKPGARVLDVGCGQGFFSGLFSELGLMTRGVDISVEAVRSAERDYASRLARFEVGDVSALPYEGTFDCVFARGLSLYNSDEFAGARQITDVLLAYLKPGGVMIFDYYSKLCPSKKSGSWIYHSLSDVKRHFSSYPGARVYFSLRLETLVFGSWSFCGPFTRLAGLISRSTGVGGELIAFVPRSSLNGREHLSGVRGKEVTAR